MKESRFSTLVSKYLQTNFGALVIPYTVDAMGTKGIPDLLVCWKGRFVAIELKTGNYQPSEIQKEMIRRINEWYDGMAFVLWDTKDWKQRLDFIDKKIERQKKC